MDYCSRLRVGGNLFVLEHMHPDRSDRSKAGSGIGKLLWIHTTLTASCAPFSRRYVSHERMNEENEGSSNGNGKQDVELLCETFDSNGNGNIYTISVCRCEIWLTYRLQHLLQETALQRQRIRHGFWLLTKNEVDAETELMMCLPCELEPSPVVGDVVFCASFAVWRQQLCLRMLADC
jgi:hypothetical protein